MLSNINLEPMKASLESEGLTDVYFAAYDQVVQELIDPQSQTNTDKDRSVLIHLDAQEFLKDAYYQLPDENDLVALMDEFLDILERWLNDHPDKIVVVANIVIPPNILNTFLNQSFKIFEQKFNRNLFELSQKYKNLLILDYENIVKAIGFNQLTSEKFWYLGRVKFTKEGFDAYAERLINLIHAFNGKTKKVLVVDLDGVLWGGVLGELGAQGVDLSEDGIGKIYRDFQKLIKGLKSLGVILAICSKNNLADVEEIFTDNSMMVLKDDDFSAKRINWENKAQNLVDIADELNVQLDSLIFIDDLPQERELVQQKLTDVVVPEFPQDIEQLNQWFLKDVIYRYFAKVSLTEEDQNKQGQYNRQSQRKDLAKKLDLTEYIKSLNIVLDIKINPTESLERLTQLTQKTNQFNITTRRYNQKEIESYLNREDVDVFALWYSDKFGEEGLIGEAIIKYENNLAVFDSFLLSCRVLGRGVEHAFMDKILKECQKKSMANVSAEYIPTQKNTLAKDFYSKCGFKQESENKYTGEINQLITNNYQHAK